MHLAELPDLRSDQNPESCCLSDDTTDLNAADFAALTRRYGIEVIAEKVEAEKQVAEILDLDIGYGQGNLFGEPRAIRDAVLAETDPPAEFLHPNPRRRVGARG